MKQASPPNYGKLLKQHLKDNGISVIHACKILKINRGTMYNRFKNGEFKASELHRVQTFLNQNK